MKAKYTVASLTNQLPFIDKKETVEEKLPSLRVSQISGSKWCWKKKVLGTREGFTL